VYTTEALTRCAWRSVNKDTGKEPALARGGGGGDRSRQISSARQDHAIHNYRLTAVCAITVWRPQPGWCSSRGREGGWLGGLSGGGGYQGSGGQQQKQKQTSKQHR
jgi:hypothetical protein